MDATRKLIEYVAAEDYASLPPEVIAAARKTVMDTLGVTLAGSAAEGCPEMADLVSDWGGKPESSLSVYGGKAPAPQVVLANATMARARDFDDCHIRTAVHPSATVVPVALAAAEMAGGVSGQALLAAIALGTEVAIRLRQVPDSCNLVSGWAGEVHSTFGAAVASGKVFGFNADQLQNAMGLAGSQTAGNLQSVVDGALGSRLQQGFAARSGLLAAVLAGRGITGARDVLDGRFGFYPVYYRGIGYDMARLTQRLGESFEILEVAAKPYPCCAYNHGPIENVLDLMRQHHLTEADVATVKLRINQRMLGVCTPPETKVRPRTVVDALFSLPYAMGTAMLHGDVFLDDFTAEAIREPERLRAVAKVSAVVDAEIDAESIRLDLPLSLHAIDLKTKSGETFSQARQYVRGYPQMPITIDDLARKLRRCAHFAARPFSDAQIDSVIDLVAALDQAPDAAAVARLLVPDTAAGDA